MGQKSSKSPITSITREVRDIRSSIRSSKGQIDDDSKQQLQRALVNYSQEVNSLSRKSKKREVDNAQKLISSVTEELLSDRKEPPIKDANLDSASVETNSFINSYPAQKPRPKTDTIQSSKTLKTLNEIEHKLNSLKPEIKAAIEAGDTGKLRNYEKVIKNLATSLEMIVVFDHIGLQEKKDSLEKSLGLYYRKVTKARSQVKRDSNIEYLTDLQDRQKRDSCIEILEAIEAELETSTEKWEDLKELQTKTNHVEELGEDIQKRKSGVLETIQQLQGRHEAIHGEKLRQAQEHHDKFKAELRKFNKGRDSLDFGNFKHYLLKLREYVEKVPESSGDISAKRKTAIEDLDTSLSYLEERAAEGDVVLRKVQESNATFSSLDAFCQQWTVLSPSLPPNGASMEDVQKINKKLGSVADSIVQKRFKLASIIKSFDGGGSVVSDRSSRLSQISQTSLNSQNSPKGDLVRVKIGELPKMNTNVSSSSSDIIIGSENIKQIEDIQMEVEGLKSRVSHFAGTGKDEEYEELKGLLESHRKTLKRLSLYRNEGIREASYALVKTIDDVLKNLEVKARRGQRSSGGGGSGSDVASRSGRFSSGDANRKSTTESVLNDVMEISGNVAQLSGKVKKGTKGEITSEDLNNAKKELLAYQDHLRRIDVSTVPATIRKSRDEVLSDVTALLQQLEFSRTAEEKKLIQTIKGLKEKVARFTGTYRNVLYKTVENDLRKSLGQIDHIITDAEEAGRLRNEVESNLKILEQKSVKDAQYGSTGSLKRNSNSHKINTHHHHHHHHNESGVVAKIREDVESVKRELYKADTKTEEELSVLDGRLTLSILALDNLPTEEEEAKRRLYQEIQGYLTFINERKSIAAPQSMIAQINQPEAEFAKIQQDLERVKAEIFNFVGVEGSEKFFEIDEFLIRNTLKIDGFKFERSHELYAKKLELLKEIQRYAELLDKRVEQTEVLQELEKETKEMVIRIDAFAGRYQDNEFNSLDEQLISLNVKLHKFGGNDAVIKRKQQCIDTVNQLSRKMAELARSGSATSGTLV